MVPEGKTGEKEAKAAPADKLTGATQKAEAGSHAAEKKSVAPSQSAVPTKKEREFVIPGDELVKGMDYLPGRNCFRKGESILAKKIGLVSISGRVISVIPLNEVYIPKTGDMVVGEVIEIHSNGWVVDIQSLIEAYLPLSGVREFIDTSKDDLSRYYSVGDVIYAKVTVANQNTVHLSMDDSRSRKFRSGRVIEVNPAKIPRLIGKQGSMISLIKTKTGCRISAGQNGLVWLEGENEDLAIRAIQLVETESYREGLTDRVSSFLEKEAGKNNGVAAKEAQA